MRVATFMLLLVLAPPAQAQTINGESTDDSAYAPRPPARWHAPDAPPDAMPEAAPLGIDPGPRPDDRERAGERR